MNRVLVLVEHDRGEIAPASYEALTFARSLGDVVALTIGAAADALAPELGVHGATEVHQAHHELLDDYNPEAWGDVVAGAVRFVKPDYAVATGTDVGNEVLAHAAAVLDVPMAGNCLAVESTDPLRVRRVRWGGSLIETAGIDAGVRLLTVAHHAVAAVPPDSPAAATPRPFDAVLDPAVARCAVIERVERPAGVTLATAPVVVGGGRGVGSAEGFAALEELAALLGGVVGCSRVGDEQRLAQSHRPGRPDGHADRPGDLHRLWHLRGDPALGGGDVVEADPGDQHRPRRQPRHQGRLCGDRRPPRRGPCNHRRDPPAPIVTTAAPDRSR